MGKGADKLIKQLRESVQARRIVLVYQAGIANVFEVDSLNMSDYGRNAKRLMQADFRSCENFALGMKAAGCVVATAGCNMAGDIARQKWTTDLESLPFSDKFSPVGITKSLADRLAELGW